jgi:hypothetical protein
MTRVLFPASIVIFSTLAFLALGKVLIREIFYPYRRTRELDEWAEDLREEEG